MSAARHGDGGRPYRRGDQRKSRPIENETLPRIHDDVAGVTGLGDPNDANNATHGQSAAIVNIKQTVRSQVDFQIRCCVGHGGSPMKSVHAKGFPDA